MLLSGFFFGPNIWAEGGIALAIGIGICGIAVNFFVEPWIWFISFLLLSPLPGGLYLASIDFFTPNHIVDWHTFFGYLLLSPVVGVLYGVFGPNKSEREQVGAPFTKKLTLTVWFLGVGLFLAGLGIPVLLYLGPAWMLATGLLAVAQLIRLKQGAWLGSMVVSIFFGGVPIFFWGFAYGAFGPTEGEDSLDF